MSPQDRRPLWLPSKSSISVASITSVNVLTTSVRTYLLVAAKPRGRCAQLPRMFPVSILKVLLPAGEKSRTLPDRAASQ